MKIVPYPIPQEPEVNEVGLNYWSLTFKNNQAETIFHAMYASKVYALSFRYKRLFFALLHFFILLIYTLSYILKTLSNFSARSLIFQLVLISAAQSFSIFTFYRGLQFIRNPSKYLALCYFFSSISLILNDENLQSILFDVNDTPFLAILPSLAILSLFYSSLLESRYFNLVIYNLMLLTVYSVLQFRDGNDAKIKILEIFILLIAYIYQIATVYLAELSNREQFMTAKLAKVGENEDSQMQENSDRIPNLNVQECITELNNVLPSIEDNMKTPIHKTIGFLSSMTKRSKNRQYSDLSLLDQISQNLDEEDKTYLEQSWSNNQIVNIRKRTKAEMKKSIEKHLHPDLHMDVVLMLKQIGINWDFDSLVFNVKTMQKPIRSIGAYCLKLFNIIDTYQIDECRLDNFLEILEKNYKMNPYHNAVHASDILASSLYLVHNSILENSLLDLDILAIVLSHLAHDIGHPGFSNRFLINFQDRLALRYNDISVLEHMHCANLFSILSDPDTSILENLEKDSFILLRKMIIDMIMATDMGKHFELLSAFKLKYYSPNTLEKLDLKLEVLRMLIKTADIGHSAKSNSLHTTWSLLICEEFFRQGDIEKESNKPISMYCDREKTIIPKSQIGFLRSIALPLYEAFSSCLGAEIVEKNCVEQVKNNISVWEFRLKTESSKTLRDPDMARFFPDSLSSVKLQPHISSAVLARKIS